MLDKSGTTVVRYILCALICVEALFYGLFVIALIADSPYVLWGIIIWGVVYTVAVIAINFLCARYKDVPIAFPLVASGVGFPVFMLIFVLLILA